MKRTFANSCIALLVLPFLAFAATPDAAEPTALPELPPALEDNELESAAREAITLFEQKNWSKSVKRFEALAGDATASAAKEWALYGKALAHRRLLVHSQPNEQEVEFKSCLDTRLRQWIRITPELSRVVTMYTKFRGFEQQPLPNLSEKPTDSREFWQRLRPLVRRFDDFGEKETDERRVYYRYWASVMEDRFPKWDGYQLDLAEFRLNANGDREAWFEAVQKQFARAPAKLERIIRWIRLYRDETERLDAFCTSLDVAALPPVAQSRLLQVLLERKDTQSTGRKLFARMDVAALPEDVKVELLRFLWHRAPDLGRTLCETFQDRSRGDLERLRYFHWRRNVEEGLPLANDMLEREAYPEEVAWKRAELLLWNEQYAEAAAAFEAMTRQPAGALKAAEAWEKAGDDDKRETILKRILKRYPESAEAKTAQKRLEAPAAESDGEVGP